ncbi:MAG: O-antigen ligase family protein [Candidatus Lernaella stagnicola]|nr:O-antigen ligase family protein [Candidatus Lernaella stagnicola]
MNRSERWAGQIDTALPWFLYVFAFFLPFSISGSQAVLAVLVLAVFARAVLRRRLGFRPGPVGWVIVAMVAWAVLAAPFSLHPEGAASRLAKYWIWLSYFVVLAALPSREVLVRAWKVLAATGGVVALYGIAQHLVGNAVLLPFMPPEQLPVTTTGAVQAVGLFDHHLTYGNSLALTLLLAAGLIAAGRVWRDRIWLACCLGTMSMALLWSYARSAWVGLLAGLIAFGAALGRRVLAAVIAGAFVVVGVAYFASPGLADRLERVVRVDKNLERIYTWKTTVDMIADHPVFGIGPGAYRQMTQTYREGYNIHWTATSHAHNSYLHFAAESGVVAGLLFALMIGLAIGVGARRRSDVKQAEKGDRLLAGALAACVCFAAASALQHNAGDAEVCMLYQFAVASAVFLARDAARDEGNR